MPTGPYAGRAGAEWSRTGRMARPVLRSTGQPARYATTKEKHMGTSWTAMGAARIDVRVVDPSEADHPVWDECGPGDTPAMVISSFDDALEIAGSLDEQEALARRIMREVWAARDRAREAVPLPPAVTFDADALRRWLTAPAYSGAVNGYTRSSHLRVPGQFDNKRHHIGDIVDDVLTELLDDKETSRHPFQLAPDITAVSAYATHNQGVFDGGVAVVVQMAGDVDAPPFDLHVGPFPFSWEGLLAGAPDEARGKDGVIRMSGVLAATLAISNIVDPINKVVDNWRKHTRPIVARDGMAASLSEDEIECALRALAEIHNGEDPDEVLSSRQRDVMARLGGLYNAEMFGGEDEDEALVWESAGTDEPGDQNATSAHTPDGCTVAFYGIGPASGGRWSFARTGLNDGVEVFHELLATVDDEEAAKNAAQLFETSLSLETLL